MLNFFKQLFCNHEYDFHRCTFGDENNRSIPNRKVEKCKICNYEKYDEMTDEDWLRSDWELVGENMRKVLGTLHKGEDKND